MNASPPPFPPVGYGLVGFGRFCRNRLIPALQQISGSRITALYKRDADQAQAAAREFNIPTGYADLQALLADPQVEAVYITSANCDHEPQALAAALAGRHVLIEKPMAISAAACRRIIAACDQGGVKLMVAHTLRFSRAVLQMRQWIEEGRLGKICAGRVLVAYDGTKSPRTWLYDHAIAGGGALMDVGVHCLDTLRFLLGEVVHFSGILQPPQELIERTAVLSLRFCSGTLGEVICSYESPYRSRLEILGERGGAWADSFTLPWAQVTMHLETNDENIVIQVDSGNPYGALLESFSRAIRGQGTVAIPGEEGLRNQKIIEDVYSQNVIQRR